LKGEGENNAVLKEVMLSERFLTKLMNNHRNQINLEEEINRNMKGKFKLLGHIGLALFLVSALILVMAPVAQASSVSNVWVELAAGAVDVNNQAANVQYIIHFTTSTALSRGVDTITVLFPDGIDTTMGTAGTDKDFTLTSAVATNTLYLVDPTGDPLGTTLGYVTCTADATIAGYRVQVTTPVDIPASTAATLKILSGATITTPVDAANNYKIKLATSQDTSFVLSSAFPIGTSLDVAPATVTNYPSSMVAGANAYYQFSFTPKTTVPIGGTVTVEFPVGTTLTSPVATTWVQVGNGVTDPNASAVSVDTAARTLTITTAETLTATVAAYIYIWSGAGISNPTTLGAKQVYIWTSTDGFKVQQSDSDWFIVADTATKLAFASKSGAYSDDATILYA